MSRSIRNVNPDEPSPLLWSMSGVAKALNVSRSTLERERAAGRFPKPDKQIGRKPLWRPATVQAWIDAASDAKGVRR